MRKSVILTAVGFNLVGVVFLIGALQLGITSRTSDGVPGAGFFPFVVSLLVLILGTALIVKTLRNPDKPSPFAMDTEQQGNKRTLRVAIYGLAIIMLLWLIAPLDVLDGLQLSETFLFRDYAFGFASIVYSLYMNRALGRSWQFSVFFAVCFFLLVHFVFTEFLYIQFDI